MNGLSVSAAFLLGLFGSLHCLGMCGGISSAFGFKRQASNGLLLSYNLGRILSYGMLGAVAGLFGHSLVVLVPEMQWVLRAIAGLLLIAMGLYLSQLWMGLALLERGGALIWRHVQPVATSFMPVHRPGKALLVGMIWGLLPCGLVYSTLAYALTASSWQLSVLIMLAFGLGTLPMMLLAGRMSSRIFDVLRNRRLRLLAALMIITMGLATLTMPLLHSAGQHTGHGVNAVDNAGVGQHQH